MKRHLLIAIALAGLMSMAGGAMAQSGHDGNPYAPNYKHAYRHGAVPTRETLGKMKQYQLAHHYAALTAATGAETLSYGGGVDGIGVTSGTPRVYVVFWGNQWGSQSTDANGNVTLSNDPSNAAPYLQQLFKGIGTGGELWSGVMTQYCDGSNVASGATSCPSNANFIGYPTGGALAGVWYDNSSAEPQSATAAQLAQEAVNAAQHFGNNTAASNRYVQYVIVSSTGLNPDGFNTSSGSFCAWHDWNGDDNVSSPVGDVAFTNMPYVTDMGSSCGENSVNSGSNGVDDGFSIVNGHEYAETITDQNPAGGWTNHTGDATYNGQEDGDECAWITSGQGATQNVTMGNGTYAMQSTWSDDTNECDISHPIVGGGGTPPPPSNTFSSTDTPVSIGDNATIQDNIAVSGVTGNAPSTLQVSVNITHNWSGDLEIDLIAPNGTQYTLQSPDYNNDGNINTTYTVNASAVAASGTWKLQVIDNDSSYTGDSGTLNNWSLTF